MSVEQGKVAMPSLADVLSGPNSASPPDREANIRAVETPRFDPRNGGNLLGGDMGAVRRCGEGMRGVERPSRQRSLRSSRASQSQGDRYRARRPLEKKRGRSSRPV